MRLGSFDGAWCTECNGTKFVTVCQILLKWGPFFVCHNNIWQSIYEIFVLGYELSCFQVAASTECSRSKYFEFFKLTQYANFQYASFFHAVAQWWRFGGTSHKYLRYCHKCGTIAFSSPSAIIWASSDIDSIDSARVCLFEYVIYFLRWPALPAAHRQCRPSQEWITYSNKPSMWEMVLTTWD